MTLQAIDRDLERLSDAAEAIRANLLEVELDPHRTMLDSSALEGETASRWSEASATFAHLWQWHALLDELLERARKLRGTRASLPAKRVEALSELLSGESIELASEHVPLEQRKLLGGSHAALRCTPEALLERSSAAFDRAKGVLAATSNAWDELAPRLQAMRTALGEHAALASELGEGEPPGLDRVRARVDDLSAKLAKDPLSASGEEVRDLERSLQALRDDLEGIERVRRELAALLADARELLDELRGVAQEGRQAHEQAIAKIAAPTVPEPLSVDSALESELEDVAKIASHGAWREARAMLEQWSARVRSLLERGRRIAAENRAPIETRNELRGLLDACQAKALRLGMIEELELSGMFKAAQETLYEAPTDLARATELVHRYRRALAELPSPRELSR